MNPTDAIKFGIGMMSAYLVLAGFFIIKQERDFALMFLVGALFWAIGLFIWDKVKSKEDKNET